MKNAKHVPYPYRYIRSRTIHPFFDNPEYEIIVNDMIEEQKQLNHITTTQPQTTERDLNTEILDFL